MNQRYVSKISQLRREIAKWKALDALMSTLDKGLSLLEGAITLLSGGIYIIIIVLSAMVAIDRMLNPDIQVNVLWEAFKCFLWLAIACFFQNLLEKGAADAHAALARKSRQFQEEIYTCEVHITQEEVKASGDAFGGKVDPGAEAKVGLRYFIEKGEHDTGYYAWPTR